ncbi:hypothetical protein [Algoriphagus sp. PAP.12]|uniref:hypothetical protein n=1 Tax=Algoriphagus sp. PAP.12 TaxID=2996678 RepID=UPI00227CBC18|nr:hypothetical protein [Algoriphagus sp. PAP.12]
MKKLFIPLILFLSFFSNISVASDSLKIQKTQRFQVGFRYFNVNNDFVDQSNRGVGVYGSYAFPLIKKYGIEGIVELGTDWLTGEGHIPKSEWYGSHIWAGAGVQKRVSIFADNDFTFGLGIRAFGISKADSWSYDPNTGERQYSYIDQLRKLHGMRIGYKFNKEPMQVNLALEKDRTYTMSSIGLTYLF